MATTERPRLRFRALRKSFLKAAPAQDSKNSVVSVCVEKQDDNASSSSKAGVLSTDVSTSIVLPKEQFAVLTPVVGPTLNLQITKIAVAPPKPGEVVVRIAWTGLCGSDPSFCVGPQPGFSGHNHIAGHEGIGHIVAGHDPALLNKPVAARYLTYSCQTCEYCLRGLPESCPRQLAFPKNLNGTFQHYITVPRHSVIQLPEYVFARDSTIHPSAYAAALCSGSAALKALRAAQPRTGAIIVVSGITGSIGHLVGLMAKHIYAAKVIGVDVKLKAEDPIVEKGDVCDRFIPVPECAEQEESFQQSIVKLCEDLRGQNNILVGADSAIICANRVIGFRNLTSYICDGGSIIIVG
ncbi:chaperonin 10-like protein [Aspergillus pseudoustus]|uniref:Chaperonin 10-like protein n=1 Tax=Aspergillus pseudoustus TaxID=1810923 RepID=A0ABR4JQP0_9EURO